MSKHIPTEEWHIAKDDADWAHLQEPPLPDGKPAANRRLRLKHYVWGVAALLLLLTTGGHWWWRTDQAALPPSTVSVTATPQPSLRAIAPDRDSLVASIMNERTNADWWLQYGWEDFGVSAPMGSVAPTVTLDIVLQTVEILDDQAVVSIITTAQNGAPAYRQTRFYRRTPTIWLRTEPDAALWGPERSLETPSFVFRFRQNDAPAVIAVASQIEALSMTIRQNFGLASTPNTEKMVIEVSMTQRPGYATSWFGAPEHILVPSPAVYRAPVALTDAELLAQSIAFPLREQVLTQASDQYQIGAAWQPLVSGLALWQVWDLNLPLAAWQEVIAQWIYTDLPAAQPGQAIPLPAHYTALCAAHKLWMPSLVQMHIPLLCGDQGVAAEYYPLGYARNPPLRLEQLAVPASSATYLEVAETDQVIYATQMVALATLLEYAVTTYGRERLPALVAGLGHYDTWDTLLPAVYGVSAAEFEAGWQAYLAAHYGIIEKEIDK